MKNVKIGDVKPGMTLFKDVLGSNGRMLSSKGTILDEKTIRVLNIWGVVEITIISDDKGDVETEVGKNVDPQDMEFARIIADELFPNASNVPMAELKRLRMLDFATKPDSAPHRKSPPPPGSLLEPESIPSSVEELVAGDSELSSFPEVYFELQKALDDPRCSTTHLADIIGRDPALAARLLRLANSPLYGFPKRITSLSRGVMLIGSQELIQLVMGVSAMSLFKGSPSGPIGITESWEHAIGCGVYAKVLASRVSGLSQERCFVAGLIHDIGRLILLRLLPSRMESAVAISLEKKSPLHVVERDLLGFDHADVARVAMTSWGLPPSLCESVGGHHAPHCLEKDPYARVIHVADIVTIAQGYGANGSPFVPEMDLNAWNLLGLPVSVLAVARSQADHLIRDIFSIFMGERL